jgi:DNA-binding response OmpR family regulator
VINVKKILIVDDNPSIVNILSDYIKKEQMNVLSVSDGEAALKAFDQWKPDMILLDVMMPKLDGFSVCKEIRKTSMVPIIMITARSEDFDKIMGWTLVLMITSSSPFHPKKSLPASMRFFAESSQNKRIERLSAFTL